MSDTHDEDTVIAGSVESTSKTLNAEAIVPNVANENIFDGEVVGDDPNKNQILPMPLTAISDMPEARSVPAIVNLKKMPLEMMFDVPITLVFEVGRTDITIQQLMELREGSFVELRHISVDAIDVRINNEIIAQAEHIAIKKRYGIRFGEVEVFTSIDDGLENA